MKRLPPKPGLSYSDFAKTSMAQTQEQTLEEPQTYDERLKQEKIRFGNQELLVFPRGKMSFKEFSHITLSKEQKCILDNLWISFNKKDQKYFLACMNSLSEHFHQTKTHFKFYVVFKGNLLGIWIFHTWIEVLDSIKDFKNPLFKGFNNLSEALDHARNFLGLNFHISPSLRTVYESPLDYSVVKDQKGKILFCDHCETLSKDFKRINEHNNLLIHEKRILLQKISDLKAELFREKI